MSFTLQRSNRRATTDARTYSFKIPVQPQTKPSTLTVSPTASSSPIMSFPGQQSKHRATTDARTYSFKIPLQPQTKPLTLTQLPNFPHFLSQEYATKYLQSLGATPSHRNIQTLLSYMPITKCKVEGVWRKDRNSLEDAIIVKVHGGLGHTGAGHGHTDGSKAKRSMEHTSHVAQTSLSPSPSPDKPQPSNISSRSPLPLGTANQHLNYSPSQKLILLRQLLMGLLKPFSTTPEEMSAAQELYCKKFPFDTLQKELELTMAIANQMPATTSTNTHKIKKVLPDLSINSPRKDHLGRTITGSPSQPLRPRRPTAPSPTKPSPTKIGESPKKPAPPSLLTSQLISYLMRPEIIRLVDLTCHYIYWTIIHPYAHESPLLDLPLRRARVVAAEDERAIIATVTECDEDGGGVAFLIKEGGDEVRDYGSDRLSSLCLNRLGSAEREKITLEMHGGLMKVRSETLRRYGRAATQLYLPMLVLAVRNAADNIFIRGYKFLTVGSSKHVGKDVIDDLGPSVWTLIHKEITRLFDPKLYHSHLAPFGNTTEAARRLETMKRGTRTQGDRVFEDEDEKHFRRKDEKRNWGQGDSEEFKNYHIHRHRNITNPSILRAKKNYYECSTVVSGMIRNPASAGARGMMRDKKSLNEYDVTRCADMALTKKKGYEEGEGVEAYDDIISGPLDLGPESRAELMKCIMGGNSKRYMSRYKTTKRRQDMDRALLLKSESDDKCREAHELMLKAKLAGKNRKWQLKGIHGAIEGRWVS